MLVTIPVRTLKAPFLATTEESLDQHNVQWRRAATAGLPRIAPYG